MKGIEIDKLIHDVKNNINSINGFLTLALENIDNKEKLSEYLYNVSISSHFILDLINYNLNKKKYNNYENEVNLISIFNELKESFENDLIKKRIEIDLKISELNNTFVYLNEILFKQIFQNLISNAIKYSYDNSIINIYIIEKNSHNKYNYSFIIEDFGCGINKKFINKLFKAYKREVCDNQGHGIGLSVVKENVNKLKGKIIVESQKNLYTRFRIDLNLKVKQENENRKFKILVIDDNDFNIILFKTFLEYENFDILSANNVFDAIKIIKEESDIDIIFIDINMPNINGIECLKKIKKIKIKNKFKKICMSADVSETNFKKYKKKGFDDYLSKPFCYYDIFNIIEKCK